LSIDAEAPLAIYGPSLPEEQDVGGSAGRNRGAIAAFPHLELSRNPRGDVRLALAGFSHAVLAYQTPAQFRQEVPILTARDLATLLTGEGFEIVDFQTEAGLTRLVGRRAGAEGSSSRVEERAGHDRAARIGSHLPRTRTDTAHAAVANGRRAIAGDELTRI
jgi:hypothetical protein